MKDKNNVFILGDSYSTYEGYIPDGYRFYYWDERTADPIELEFEEIKQEGIL